MARAIPAGSEDDPYFSKDERELEEIARLDAANKSWMNSLHHVWSLWKKSPGVARTLCEYFESAPNPYYSALKILVNTNDFYKIKPSNSLALTVMDEFMDWIKPMKEKYKDCLVVELKIAAYKLVARQKNAQLLRTVSNVYEFANSKKYFIPITKLYVNDKKYKEAGQLVELCQLQDEFSEPEILILPLILQNKNSIAEGIMKNHPHLQTKLVTFLDNMLAPDNNPQQIMDRYIIDNSIPDVQFSTYQIKSIAKLVARLAKQFNLPPEACPYLHKKRGAGAVQFLVYKRYVDCSLSADSFREMVKEAIGDDTRMQLNVVITLSGNDVPEAYNFAKFYNIPKSDWPLPLTIYEKDNRKTHTDDTRQIFEEECWDEEDRTNYYNLSLPRDKILIVDNREAFKNFLGIGLFNVDIVGIDSEWKPSFSIKKPELALIQIATQSNIYILDVIKLGPGNPDLWTKLGTNLLNNKDILKLGFGIVQDINVIQENLPALSNIKVSHDGYLDLSHLWKRLLEEDQFSFPYKGDENFTNENLSKLVELCFGAKLNKSNQFSNWERRPLRENQIIYAALDAYCLLEIYNTLNLQCRRLGISFPEVCNTLFKSSRKSAQRERTKKSRKSNNAFTNRNPYKNYGDVLPDRAEQNFKTIVEIDPLSRKLTNEKVQNMYECSNSNNDFHRHHSPVEEATVEATLLHSHGEKTSNKEDNQTRTITSISFVCDSMFGALARQLRKCGIDCFYIANDTGGEHNFRLALANKRVLLTRNVNYKKFAQYLPFGHCYEVVEHKPVEQLVEVLQHFKIKVKESNIFSRCQVCNTNEFVYVSKNTMSLLLQRFQAKSAQKTNRANSEPGFSGDNADQIWNNDHPTPEQFICRSWRLFFNTLNISKCTTKYNVNVQIDQVPPNVLRYVDKFYVCEGCGKVYWFGSHMEKALNSYLGKILT
ncbi:hypothetical protein TKK_0007911 [Trichogramma kaykai]|uniref:3'-5' exonuclease domain-containing protein n=1 Tax=Trichogramma kaykai TaxID=54128 RepID=A0ABD2X8G0_9HYME